MNTARPPSEGVVAHALRNTLPEFLVDTSEGAELKKFLLAHADIMRCQPFQSAA
jgi:hypothetical protein